MEELKSALSIAELKKLTNQLRYRIIKMSHDAKGPHLGSSLSCLDILTVLYWNFLKINPDKPEEPDRDRFILSKGHAAPALYAVLAHRGFIPMDELNDFLKEGGHFAEHACPDFIPGVEAATGSLGHGLPFGLGMALAAKKNAEDYFTYVVLSDGECNEGSVWEAALFASANKLDNVIAFVDYNKWQATGRSNEVLGLASLINKWEAFGWNCFEINGNDVVQLVETLKLVSKNSGKPTMIICNTIKGKGVSFMEDDNNWHYKIPNSEELLKAKKELGIE